VADEDDLSERTDSDKLESGMRYPPDQPLGANDRGVTDASDSVDERRRRENPDRWRGRNTGDVGAIVDDHDESGVDDESELVAMEAREERDPLGLGRSTQDLEEVEPAEEAARHLTEDPPMDDDDGYVND
jgi:hypothetical protein